MRRVLALLALIALVLAGCGGDDSSSSGATTTKASGDDSTTSTTDSDSGGGDVDCAAVKAAFTKFVVPVQLLAQARTLDQLKAIKDGTVGDYDPDEFLETIATLRVLEGHKSVLGDPKEALDAFEAAGEKMKALFEEAAPTEAEVQAYADSIGSVSVFLGHQAALAAAVDDAGC